MTRCIHLPNIRPFFHDFCDAMYPLCNLYVSAVYPLCIGSVLFENCQALRKRPNNSPKIIIGSHMCEKPPSRQIKTNSSGHTQNRPRPKRNFAVPQARRSPVFTMPNKSIIIRININMRHSSCLNTALACKVSFQYGLSHHLSCPEPGVFCSAP